MNAALQWMVKSRAFRKASGMVGGFCAGMWVSATYWRQIKATLDVWGVSHETWMAALLGVMAAALSAGSVALTMANKRRVAGKGGES